MNKPMTGAPAMTTDRVTRFKALLDAIVAQNLPTVRTLVNRECNDLLALQLRGGMDALHVAAQCGNPAIAQHLIDMGAELCALVEGPEGDFFTPLDLARLAGRHDTVAVLLAACEAQNVRDGESRCAHVLHRRDGTMSDVCVCNLHTGDLLTDGTSIDVGEQVRQAALANLSR